MTADDRAPPALSVIVPCFDESESIGKLLDEIDVVLDGLGQQAEVIVVDDASRDDTLAVLRRLRDRHPRLRIAAHAVNAGQSAAYATGFRLARGRLIVTMDGDGQHDPADLPRLLAALGDADLVTGVRRGRREGTVRKLSSKIGNGFRNAVTRDRVSDAGCTFRVIRREALAEVPVFNGMHRFLVTLLRWQGCRVVEVDIAHRAREAGTSKYGVGNRAWRGILDCLAMRWFRKRLVPGQRLADVVEPDPRPATDPGSVTLASSDRIAGPARGR